MTYEFSTFLDITLVALIVGVAVGFIWGQRTERSNWNKLIEMKVFPLPPKWVKKWYPGTGEPSANYWLPENPPAGTPVWDDTNKVYVHLSPADFRRHRGLF